MIPNIKIFHTIIRLLLGWQVIVCTFPCSHGNYGISLSNELCCQAICLEYRLVVFRSFEVGWSWGVGWSGEVETCFLGSNLLLMSFLGRKSALIFCLLCCSSYILETIILLLPTHLCVIIFLNVQTRVRTICSSCRIAQSRRLC